MITVQSRRDFDQICCINEEIYSLKFKNYIQIGIGSIYIDLISIYLFQSMILLMNYFVQAFLLKVLKSACNKNCVIICEFTDISTLSHIESIPETELKMKESREYSLKLSWIDQIFPLVNILVNICSIQPVYYLHN